MFNPFEKATKDIYFSDLNKLIENNTSEQALHLLDQVFEVLLMVVLLGIIKKNLFLQTRLIQILVSSLKEFYGLINLNLLTLLLEHY